MTEQILSCKEKFGKVIIVYTVYQPTKRRFDIGNVCSVHQKFFEDALTELGRLEDDRFNYVPMCVYLFGGISPTNPRVDIQVISGKEEIERFLNKTLVEKIDLLYNDNVGK